MRSIAEKMGRHHSTLYRELDRNRCYHIDGAYRPSKAERRTVARRKRSRRNRHYCDADFKVVRQLLKKKFSPEQVTGYLRRLKLPCFSHETIYLYIWRDKAKGGNLWTHLRQSIKIRRKRYIVTLVERKTGFIMIGKLKDRSTGSLNKKTKRLISRNPLAFKTITADNGTEFHQYKAIEAHAAVKFYFANPYHSWERGSNENANGLVRQYIPKGTCMEDLTQQQCDHIANELNSRPRKRHQYQSPEELFYA